VWSIVLLPGMDGTGALLEDFAHALRKDFRPIVVSYPPNVPLGYPELEELARSRLPTREPFVLLGESFSGPVAVEIAATRPMGLRGLVIVSSFAKSPYAVPTWLRAPFALAPLSWAPMGVACAILLGTFSTPRLQAQLATALSSVSSVVWRRRLRSVMDADARARMAEIDVPILYIRGSRDRVVPKSAASVVHSAARNVRVAELDGPHLVLQSKPSDAAILVGEFGRQLGLRSGEKL